MISRCPSSIFYLFYFLIFYDFFLKFQDGWGGQSTIGSGCETEIVAHISKISVICGGGQLGREQPTTCIQGFNCHDSGVEGGWITCTNWVIISGSSE